MTGQVYAVACLHTPAGLQDTLRAGNNASIVTVCAYDAWGNPTYLIDPALYMPTISTVQNVSIVKVRGCPDAGMHKSSNSG
jgi:hypothetical protein